jgi:hypothetical protein
MFDEETVSLWPQLCLAAGYGPRKGTGLTTVPIIEMRWESWKKLHPNTLVVSEQTGFTREYRRYPYGGYEKLSNPFVLFPGPEVIDERRSMKERVLGIPDERGGIAFPFEDLAEAGALAVISSTVSGREVRLLWDNEAKAAAAYYPETTDGVAATVRAIGGRFADRETGSTWSVEGLATAGPMVGSRLVQVWWEVAWSRFLRLMSPSGLPGRRSTRERGCGRLNELSCEPCAVICTVGEPPVSDPCHSSTA